MGGARSKARYGKKGRSGGGKLSSRRHSHGFGHEKDSDAGTGSIAHYEQNGVWTSQTNTATFNRAKTRARFKLGSNFTWKGNPSRGGKLLSTTPEDCHPFLIPRVMTRLFEHLDVPTLKIARLVCKDWKSEATKLILTKAVAHLDGETHSNRYLIDNFLRSMDQNSTQRYSRYRLTSAKYEVPFRRLFTIYGHHMKSLTLDSYDGEVDHFRMDFLNKLLKNCPNLEEIDMYCPSDDFLDPNSTLTCEQCKLKKITLRAEDRVHRNFLQDLINTCPDLKSFSILQVDAMRNTSIALDLFQLGETERINLAKLEWLDIGGSTSVLTTKAALASLSRQTLNLSFLEITLQANVTVDKELQQMLQNLSGTLRCFILANYPGTVSPAFPVLIPSTMTKLEKLEIRTGTSQFFMGPVNSAVNLPRLKTFIMHRMPHLEVYGERIPGVHYDFGLCWSLLENVWFASRSQTLESLQLPCGFNAGHHFCKILTVFPNVSDLRLQNPSEEILRLVFMSCTDLERLSIRLKEFPANINSLLSGLAPWTCGRMTVLKQFENVSPLELKMRGPGLRNMKHLKYFELKQWEEDYSSLSEVALWYGLIYLTNARQIDLNGCESVSPESIDQLRAALGPACYVNIEGKESRMDYSNFWARDGFSNEMKFCL